MQFVRFQFSHHFLARKMWLITSLRLKANVELWKYSLTFKSCNTCIISFDCNFKSMVVLSQLFILKQIPVQIPFDISNNIFSVFKSNVDFFCFFGEILIYDFAPAGNVLNLIFRTYKKSSFTNSQFCQISRKM